MFNFQEVVWFMMVIRGIQFLVYLVTFLMAVTAIKLNIKSEIVERLLMVMVIVGTYPRHKKYFAAGSKT